ncbi:hypothetical protein [uncultured Intestinimonas sp.]|mgnify:CR=1 FL=1|uniref:hypothetical protein n=1 Tax=uncultured Intestinimonas sp. TaxID=1689265 RepID=UPI002941EC0E|nr:hypothetical protein [uncultured Intestinimonas sp.]
MDLIWINSADLHRFDGGEGGAPAGDNGGPGSSQPGETGEGQGQTPDGKAPDAGGQQEKTGEQLKEEFGALIKGEYKDAFSNEVQAIINRRFKETKGLQEQLSAQQPLMDKLMARYNIEGGDVAALDRAIDADDALWSQAAEDAGLTVEQYRRVQNMELENMRLKRAERENIARQMAQRQVEAWQQQAQEIRAEYPGFDLEAEIQNPTFKAMLKAGAPMKNAYEAIHMGEIKAGVAQQASAEREKQVTDNIRARGQRPTEGGSSGAGITYSSDPSKLTAKEREELARRAERGERITFQ